MGWLCNKFMTWLHHVHGQAGVFGMGSLVNGNELIELNTSFLTPTFNKLKLNILQDLPLGSLLVYGYNPISSWFVLIHNQLTFYLKYTANLQFLWTFNIHQHLQKNHCTILLLKIGSLLQCGYLLIGHTKPAIESIQFNSFSNGNVSDKNHSK